MKKRSVALCLAVVMAAETLGGCSGGSTGKAAVNSDAAGTAAAGSESAGTEPAAADPSMYEVTEPITIKWWHSLEDQYSDTVNQIVEDFNNSQDLITVEAEYVGSYAKTNEALVAAHAAGTGLPAITVANTPYVAEYGAGGLTEDLTPYIEASGYDIEDFGDGMILAAQYEGKQVSLPFLISTQILFYNKDLTDELGIKIPTTWEEMDTFMQEGTQKAADGSTERYATIIPGWDQWYYETFYLNQGVNIINDDQISTDLGDETAVQIAEKIQEWCDNGYTYWTGTADDASSNMRQNFISGKALSVVHTTSLYNTYVDQCDFEVGMAWLPGGDTRNQEIGGCVLLIPAKNDQATKNAAWQFLQYLCSKDVNMTWAEGTGYMPTRKSVLETEEGKEFLEKKPAFQAIFDNLDLIYPRIQHKAWSQLATIWKNSMAEVMIEGGDVPAAMEEMADEINDVLEDS
ncbi:MAG: ABC transporter substrate-binding protein [Clostridiales bacterium]|nr:ABC transporter substrate-binding protein [Clostridiales bacterium]